MTANNSPICPTCKGTQWTPKGLCRSCESPAQAAKDSILDRVARGSLTVDDAHAELDKLGPTLRHEVTAAMDALPACHDPADLSAVSPADRLELKRLEMRGRINGIETRIGELVHMNTALNYVDRWRAEHDAERARIREEQARLETERDALQQALALPDPEFVELLQTIAEGRWAA